MATGKNTALATFKDFQLARTDEGLPEEIREELEDELEDLDPGGTANFQRIKIPAGGGTAFEIEGEDGEPSTYQTELNAVLVFTHKTNAFWPGAVGDGDQGRAPTCVSTDGKVGLNSDTGELINCATCPLNQFGSGVDQNGKPSRGKACKNMRRLYLALSGDPALYLLSVPPTSMGDVNKQLGKILSGGIPYTGLVIRLTLERTKSAGGSPYSKVVLRKAGKLPPETVSKVIALRRKVKDQLMSVAVTLGDYIQTVDEPQAATPEPAPAPAPAPVQATQAPAEEPLPWDNAAPVAEDDDLPF